MLILDTVGDTIQAEGSAASSFTITLYGIETVSGSNTYKKLGQSQLTGSGTQDTIYTVPANTSTICSVITIANTSGIQKTIKLWHVPNGGSPGDNNAILGTITIPANTTIAWNKGNLQTLPTPALEFTARVDSVEVIASDAGALASDNLISILSIETIGSDNVIAIDSVETIVSDNVIRIDSIETLASDNVDRLNSIETIASDAQVSANSIETIASDNSIAIASIEIIASDNTTAINSIETLVSNNIIAIASVETIASDNTISIASVETIASDNTIAIASVETLVSDAQLELDLVSDSVASVETLASDNIIAHQSLETLASDNLVAIQSVEVIASDNTIRIESIETVASDNVISITSIETIASDNTIAIASVEILVSDAQLELDLVSDSVLSVETVASDAGVNASDNLIRIESIETLSSDNEVAHASLETLISDNTVRIDSIETIASDSIVAIASVETLASDNAIAIASVETVASDNTVAIGSIETIASDNAVAIASVETIISDALVGTVPFDNITMVGQGTIGQPGTGPVLLFHDTDNKLTITGASQTVFNHTASLPVDGHALVQGYKGADVASFCFGTFLNGNGPAYFKFLKSRNATIGAKTIVQNNDHIGILAFYGDDGVNYDTVVAKITVDVDGVPAAHRIPGEILFETATGAGDDIITTNMRIAADGGIHIPNIKSGTDQANAGATAGELYFDTDDGNTVKIGV